MSEKKTYKCILSDSELIKSCAEQISQMCKTGGSSFTMRVPVDLNNDTDILLSELVDRFAKLSSQSRTTLTLEEEQAMDKLVFPVTYRQKSMIVQDKKKKSIVSLYGSELADATADIIGGVICRLLNAEQKRRGK